MLTVHVRKKSENLATSKQNLSLNILKKILKNDMHLEVENKFVLWQSYLILLEQTAQDRNNNNRTLLDNYVNE